MRVLLILALCIGLIACSTSTDKELIENKQIDLKTAISSYTSFYENGMTIGKSFIISPFVLNLFPLL